MYSASFDQEILENLLQQARELVPTLQASMEQTFANQAHYRWEGLNSTRLAVTVLCQQVNEQLRVMIHLVREQPDLYQALPSSQEFLKNINIIHKDLQEYNRRLSEIHSKHQNLTGVVHGSGQVASFVNIWESYVEWAQSFCDVALPLFADIYRDVCHACEKLEASTTTRA